MRRTLPPLAAFATVALISVISSGCGSNASAEAAAAGHSATGTYQDKLVSGRAPGSLPPAGSRRSPGSLPPAGTRRSPGSLPPAGPAPSPTGHIPA